MNYAWDLTIVLGLDKDSTLWFRIPTPLSNLDALRLRGHSLGGSHLFDQILTRFPFFDRPLQSFVWLPWPLSRGAALCNVAAMTVGLVPLTRDANGFLG